MGSLHVLIGKVELPRPDLVASFERLLQSILQHQVQAANSLRRLQQLIAEFGGDDERYVLMFSNGFDFATIDIAEIEAVLQRQHPAPPALRLRDAGLRGHGLVRVYQSLRA
jgi:hypothetical protein